MEGVELACRGGGIGRDDVVALVALDEAEAAPALDVAAFEDLEGAFVVVAGAASLGRLIIAVLATISLNSLVFVSSGWPMLTKTSPTGCFVALVARAIFVGM